MSYKAKRIVIGVAAAVALFTAASVGTYFYIKGNESAQATENTEQVTEQNKDTNADTNSNNSESTSNDQNNGQTTDNHNRAVDNAGTPAQTTDTTTTRTTTDDDGTRTRTTTNADGTTTTIRMNTDGTTTTTVRNPDGTISSQTTDANVVTEIEEEERLVSKDDWVGWMPEAVPVPVVARIASDLDINKYKISIVKEVISTDANEDGKYDLGETITYKITVSNIGNTKLSDLKISDTINDKENITTMLNVDENDALIRKIDNITEYSFDLEAGEETFFEYSYTVKEEDIIEGVVQNSATVTNNKVEETTTITTETEEINADYEVTKVADKKEVKAGDVVTYTITVKNTGNVTLKDLAVKDEMIKLDTTIESLSVGEVKEFTGTYTVTQDDIDEQKVITNTVTVGDKTTTEEITPEPENKDYTVEKKAVVTRNGVEVTDKDENGNIIVKAGDKVNYTITVTNTGNVTLKGLKLTDEMLKITEQELGNIEVGKSKEVTGTHTVLQKEIDDQDPIVNTAVVGNKEDTETVVPEEGKPDYTVEKTAVVTRNGVEVTDKDENGNIIVKAGDKVNYTITVTNTGNVTLKGLKLTDEMLKITEQELGNIEVGKSKEVTGTHTVLQKEIDDQDPIVNTAVVGNKEDTETVVPEEGKPDYTVEKTAVVTRNSVEVTDKDENGNIIVKAGDKVNYTITVTNTGNVTLKGLKLTDEMLKITEQELGNIEVGKSKEVTGTHTVLQKEIDDQDPIVNTAVVGNKEDTETVVPEEGKPDYTVEKTAVVTRNSVEVTDKDENGNIIVKAGDKVNYTITVTNTGNVTLKGLKLTDEMLKITEQELGNIEVGKSKEVTGTHTVLQKEIDDQDPIVNTAVVGNKEDTVIVVPEELPKYPYTVISKVQEIKPVNYILVVDDSTSMANSHVADGTTTRLAAANTAINAFAKALFTNQDTSDSTQLTIVRFYGKGKADAIIEKKKKDDYNDSPTYTVPKNTNTPGTNMEAGLVLAETCKEPSMENVVIILSDGAINNGANDATTLKEKIVVNDNNTEIYSIGFGSEAADPSNSIYKLLQDISTDGKVHSSDGVDTLIAALTGAAYHTESSNKKETLDGKEVIYTGSTPLNMVTLEYENLMNPITARFNNQTGTYGIFTYSLDNGIYTLSVDFSQYLDKNDIVITYYKKTTQSQTATTETLDNADSNTSESLNDTSLLPEVTDETSSKDDVTNIQEEPETDKEDKSTTVEEPTNNETVDSFEENNNDNETKKEEDRKENTEVKEDDAEKEKQLASDTKESEEKEDEKLVPEKDADNTATNQTEKTETNEVIEENPNITTTEIIENPTE